jgi:hypothetical protein
VGSTPLVFGLEALDSERLIAPADNLKSISPVGVAWRYLTGRLS